MNIAQGLFPTSWLVFGYLLYGAGLAWALLGIDYAGFMRVPRRQHIFGGASIAIMLLWLLRAGISPGLGVHILGITALTLLLGWRLAIVGATVALVGTAFTGTEEWSVLGLLGVVTVLVPVGVTYCIWSLLDRHLPANLFIYILGCGFFGAGIATALARLVAGCMLIFSGAVEWGTLSEEYMPISLLILFPESFINGMIIAAFATYRPDWLATLDAQRYFNH